MRQLEYLIVQKMGCSLFYLCLVLLMQTSSVKHVQVFSRCVSQPQIMIQFMVISLLCFAQLQNLQACYIYIYPPWINFVM